jgi:hypothetical protein
MPLSYPPICPTFCPTKVEIFTKSCQKIKCYNPKNQDLKLSFWERKRRRSRRGEGVFGAKMTENEAAALEALERLKVVFCIWCAEIIEEKLARRWQQKSKKKRRSVCFYVYFTFH